MKDTQEERKQKCPRCQAVLKERESCPRCEDDLQLTVRDANTMTGDERVAEMEQLSKSPGIRFSTFHKRIEQLIGRPVWTHEIGLAWKALVEEARTRKHPSMQDIIELVPADKRVVIVVDDKKPKPSL